MTALELVGGVLLGLVTGVLSGALGVGGGVVMVPAMVLLMGVSQQTAQGTSLLVILPTAISGAYGHFRNGYLDQPVTLAVGLVGAGSAVAGSLLALNMDHTRLRQVFGLYLLVTGGRMLLSRGRRAAPETAEAGRLQPPAG
jgi:uncharacterized membrane protein YfcA